MNYHLFLDLLAWVGGVFFLAVLIITTTFWQGILLFVAATLCWAWIIAG